MAGGQSMIGSSFDQSRHRAARVAPRHQKQTVEVAAMAFRLVMRVACYGSGLRPVKRQRLTRSGRQWQWPLGARV